VTTTLLERGSGKSHASIPSHLSAPHPRAGWSWGGTARQGVGAPIGTGEGGAGGDEVEGEPRTRALSGELFNPERLTWIYTAGDRAVMRAVRTPVRPATRGRRVVSIASRRISASRRV
jgi:hypothetical protein